MAAPAFPQHFQKQVPATIKVSAQDPFIVAANKKIPLFEEAVLAVFNEGNPIFEGKLELQWGQPWYISPRVTTDKTQNPGGEDVHSDPLVMMSAVAVLLKWFGISEKFVFSVNFVLTTSTLTTACTDFRVQIPKDRPEYALVHQAFAKHKDLFDKFSQDLVDRT